MGLGFPRWTVRIAVVEMERGWRKTPLQPCKDLDNCHSKSCHQTSPAGQIQSRLKCSRCCIGNSTESRSTLDEGALIGSRLIFGSHFPVPCRSTKGRARERREIKLLAERRYGPSEAAKADSADDTLLSGKQHFLMRMRATLILSLIVGRKVSIARGATPTRVYLLPSRKWHWECPDCRHGGAHRFSDIAGTIFENTKVDLRQWFRVIHMMLVAKKGISALQVQRTIGFGSYRTAWYMCHRVRVALQDKEFRKLMGVVEVDETYIGGKNKNRHSDKRTKGTGGEGKETVVGAIERKGNIVARVIENAQLANARASSPRC
jgi:ISXO2-like transposase domain